MKITVEKRRAEHHLLLPRRERKRSLGQKNEIPRNVCQNIKIESGGRKKKKKIKHQKMRKKRKRFYRISMGKNFLTE